MREVQAELALGQGSQHPTAQPVQPATQNGWNTAAPAPAPVQSGSPAGVPGVSCPHGPMTRRTGNSSRGPWTGYFCKLEKGNPEQCRPKFADN